MPETGLTS